MPTYKNCYRLVRDVRYGIGEFDEALASGEDNVGGYANEWIIDRINDAVAQLFALILRRRPSEFIKEQSITGVNSVFALPADFGKLVLFRDQYGQKVFPISQIERRLTDQTGSERLYYQRGQNLHLDKDGVSSTYSLIYKPKPRKLHMGRAAADGIDEIALDAKQRAVTDGYYNGMIVENESSGWECEITDYTAGVATTNGFDTVASDLYGLVPELPEWAHLLIAPQAVILCKLHPLAKEPPSTKELDAFKEMLRSVLSEFASMEDDDQDAAEMFTKFEPIQGGGPVF
jgi:hypothetical protein